MIFKLYKLKKKLFNKVSFTKLITLFFYMISSIPYDSIITVIRIY